MGMPIYLYVEGEKAGPIEGSVKQVGLEGSQIIQAFSNVQEIPFDNQSGQPTSKRIHRPLGFTTYLNRATPAMFNALVSGERLTLEFKFYRIRETGEEEHYYTIKVSGAILVKMDTSLPDALNPQTLDYGHMVEHQVTYRRIELTHEIDSQMAYDDWLEPKSA